MILKEHLNILSYIIHLQMASIACMYCHVVIFLAIQPTAQGDIVNHSLMESVLEYKTSHCTVGIRERVKMRFEVVNFDK